MGPIVAIKDPVRLPRLTIDMIDRQLADGFTWLRFQPNIENAFKSEIRAARSAELLRTSLSGILIFDLYLLIDWQVLPDMFVLALICRIAVFTPSAGLAIYAARRSGSMLACEWLTVGLGCLAVALPLMLFVESASPLRGCYHYGAILTMTYVAVVQRARFGFVLAQTVGSLAAIGTALFRTDAIADAMRATYMSFHVTAAILLVLAAYELERAARRNYLLGLRARLLAAQLEVRARVDPLTGLLNRRVLNQEMQSAWRDCTSGDVAMSVILIDIDHFKQFNDVGGHLGGDACLRRFSASLLATLRERNVRVVRFGGEEFVVFGPGLDLAGALAMASALRQALHREAIPHPAFRPGAIVTASFGVATVLAPVVGPTALLAAADRALYQAKAGGRDCIRMAGPLEDADDRVSA